MQVRSTRENSSVAYYRINVSGPKRVRDRMAFTSRGRATQQWKSESRLGRRTVFCSSRDATHSTLSGAYALSDADTTSGSLLIERGDSLYVQVVRTCSGGGRMIGCTAINYGRSEGFERTYYFGPVLGGSGRIVLHAWVCEVSGVAAGHDYSTSVR